MSSMARLFPAVIFGFLLVASATAACGGGEDPETPGDRVTDPARVPSSTPIQNATLFKIQGNEVQITGGSSSQITPVAATTPTSTDYVVKSGDLCSTIAVANKISLDELQKANRSIDCNALKIGDKLKIPGAAAATPTRAALTGNPTQRPRATATPGASGKTYTVLAGDTCAGIVASKGTTIAAFLAANPSINPECSNLSVGQVVTLP
jgi:LysM repeat protein